MAGRTTTQRCAAVVMLCCSLAVTISSPADDRSPRNFPVPGHGRLELSVPENWTHEAQTMPGLPDSIAFTPREGDEFLILITPLWSARGDKDFNSAASIERLMNAEREHLAPQAVEKELVLEPLNGGAARGLYFVATDKKPKPGEWEYVYRAGVGVGDLLLSATILTHQKDSKAVKDALLMLRDARHRAPGRS